MFKVSFIMIVVTAAAVFFRQNVAMVLHGIRNVIQTIIFHAVKILPHMNHIKIVVDIIVLCFVPIIVAAIPAYLYWALKKESFPYFKHLALFLWVIVLVVFLV